MQKSATKHLLKWVGIIVLVAIFFSCTWSLIWFYNLDAPSLEKGSQKAQPVINAIQAYRQKTGNFPRWLWELKPEYLSVVPKPDRRHQYEYAVGPNGKAFALAFVPQGEAIGDGWYVYCSRLNKWQRTDSEGWAHCIYTDEDFDD